MEEEKAVKKGSLYDSYQLAQYDCERVKCILEKIETEGRITVVATEEGEKVSVKK